MDARHDEEQLELARVVRQLLRDRCPPARVREVIAGDGLDADTYGALVQLGALELPGPIEEALVAEELGRAVTPVPYSLAAAGRAAAAAAGFDDLVGAAASGTAIPVLAGGGGLALADGTVSGTVAVQAWAVAATHLVAPVDGRDGPRVVVLDAEAVDVTALEGIDATTPVGRLTADRAPCAARSTPEVAAAATVAGERRGAVLLAAELVGVAEACLDIGVAHAKEREAFGRPIGTYQAVSHQLADTWLDLELARSLTAYAAWAVAEGSADADLAVSSAKAAAGQAGVDAAHRAIQVLGGMGFTWEHDLHLYLKRARSCAALLGTPSVHRQHIAAALLTPS